MFIFLEDLANYAKEEATVGKSTVGKPTIGKPVKGKKVKAKKPKRVKTAVVRTKTVVREPARKVAQEEEQQQQNQSGFFGPPKDTRSPLDRDRTDPFKNTRRAISSGATVSRELRGWVRLPSQLGGFKGLFGR